MEELLGYLDSHQIPIKLPDPAPTNFMEGLFTLDSDKALYIQLATDGLGDFAGGYGVADGRSYPGLQPLRLGRRRRPNAIGRMER